MIQKIHLKIHNLLPQTRTTIILQEELDKIEPDKSMGTVTSLFCSFKEL